MSLRSLSTIYLVCAVVFGILAARQDYPDWAEMTDRVMLEWRDTAMTRIADAVDELFPDRKPAPVAEQEPSAIPPAPREPLPSDRRLDDPKPVAVTPSPLKPVVVEQKKAPLPPASLPELRIAEAEKPAPRKERIAERERPRPPAVLPPPPPRMSIAANPAEVARVRDRLEQSLTTELARNFELFLYVSKAESGPWAQRMYVFEKKNGALQALHVWPVSTGREKVEYNKRGEKLPSYTPAGYYQLDPRRSYRKYRSVQWDQNMPWAMFFTWIKDGNETGLAIHGAEGPDIALLGKRASAGCVRLAPENAELLYNLIRNRYRGQVPRFAYDKRTATMSNDGMLKRDRQGKLDFTDGYKALVFIENNGGQDVVAALF